MKKPLLGGIAIVMIAIGVLAFSSDDADVPPENSLSETVSSEIDPDLISNAPETSESEPSEPRIQKSDLFLGISGMETDDPQQFIDGKEQVGANVVLVPIAWDSLETGKEKYDDKEFEKVKSFYTEQGIKVAIGINPIDTNNLRVPGDLKDKNFDDPEMIDRYNKMMTYVLENVDDDNIISVNVGNEIDGYLNESSWPEYIEFFKQTSEHIKSINPEINVGSKVTFGGFFKHEDFVNELNQYSDVAMVTYYPLAGDFSFRDPSVVESDIKSLVGKIEQPIYIMEIGYASGDKVGSIEKQRQFVVNVFKAWDSHDSIKMINFVWMDDVSPLLLAPITLYYGVVDGNFAEFLGTLGLRYEDKTPKEAWIALVEETKIRGWH